MKRVNPVLTYATSLSYRFTSSNDTATISFDLSAAFDIFRSSFGTFAPNILSDSILSISAWRPMFVSSKLQKPVSSQDLLKKNTTFVFMYHTNFGCVSHTISTE